MVILSDDLVCLSGGCPGGGPWFEGPTNWIIVMVWLVDFQNRSSDKIFTSDGSLGSPRLCDF